MASRVVMFIGLLLALPYMQSAHEDDGGSAEIDPGSPTLVPLKKLSVPVRRNGKIVSHKYTFAGTISLGIAVNKPAQEFSVVFDTGSGQLVLPHEQCESPACRVHRRYNEADSDSGVIVNANKIDPKVGRDTVHVTYGTGTITGQLVREHVCLGSKEAADEAHKRKCIEMGVVTATAMSNAPFLELQFDGIVGLGLSALAVTPEFSFLNRMAASGGRASFAIYLSPADGNDADHELAVSGYNPQRFTGPLHWTPVHRPQQGFWQVNIVGVRVGNETLDICKNGGCPGIVDTGSSHLGLPKDWLRPLSNLLTTESQDGADCREAVAPDMYLDFEGFSLKLGSRDYMRKMPLAETSGQDAEEKLRCRPKLVPVFIPSSFTTQNFFILGEPLFTRYYTIFEEKEKRVGFGLARHKADEDKDTVLDVYGEGQETVLLMQVRVEFSLELNPGFDLVGGGFYGEDVDASAPLALGM